VRQWHGLQVTDDVVALAVGGRYSTDKHLTYGQYNSLTRAHVAVYDARAGCGACPRTPSAGTDHARGLQDAARELALNATYYPTAWQRHAVLA
jgi:hypothetical protein